MRSALTQPPPPIVGASRNPSNTRRFDRTRTARAGPRPRNPPRAGHPPQRGARSAPETSARHRAPHPPRQGNPSPAAGPHDRDHQDHDGHPWHARPQPPHRASLPRKAQPAPKPGPPQRNPRPGRGKPASEVRPQSGTPARQTGHQYPDGYGTDPRQREALFSNNRRHMPVWPLSGQHETT